MYFFAAHTGHGSMSGYADLTIAIVIIAAGYLLSLWIHPWTACRACKGRSRHRGTIYRYAFGDCLRCRGSGRKLRSGVRVLHMNPHGRARK